VLKTHALRGFTIIELMVTITILAVMMLLAIPSMTSYLQSARLASAAGTYQAGLQLARTEALRRNLPVEYVLTDTPIAAGIENSAVPSVGGRNWLVRFTDTTQTPPVVTLIEAKSALEGSSQAIVVTGAASPVSPAAFAGSVFFDGFGATSPAGTDIALQVANPAGGACAPAGPMRCLYVVARAGGQVGVCDKVAAVGDSRACGGTFP
jgi:type IV fimbrial biogenesis protein FimT